MGFRWTPIVNGLLRLFTFWGPVEVHNSQMPLRNVLYIVIRIGIGYLDKFREEDVSE